jgi:ABC-type polysaccharide/polyol phosphate export permease
MSDILNGIKNYRLWHLMGTADLRRRYARSKLGDFWLTLSTGVMIGALGLVSGLLFKVPQDIILPHIGVSMVLWFFITGFIIEAVGVFSGNATYFLNQRLAFSTVVMSLAYRNIITLAHNSVTVLCIFLWFGVNPGWNAFMIIPALFLTLIAGFFAAYLIGMLCARYRDFQHIITNIMTIAFYITPIFWKEDIIPESAKWFIDYNPFTHFLLIMREPMLGRVASLHNWTSAISITFGLMLIALPIISKYRKNLIYWL